MLPSRPVPASTFGVAVPPMLNPAGLSAPADADPQAQPDFARQLGQARLPQPQPPQAAAAPPAAPQAQDADAGAPRAGAQAKQAAGNDPAAERQSARQREARAQAQKKAASAPSVPTVPARPAQVAAGDEDEARRAARPVGNARTEHDDDQQAPAAVPTITATTAGSAPLPDTAGPALVTAHASLPQAPALAASALGDAGEDSSAATTVSSPAQGSRGAASRHSGGKAAADPGLIAASAAAPEPRLEAGRGGLAAQTETEAAAPAGPGGSPHPGSAGSVSAATTGSTASAGVATAAQAGESTSFQAQLSAALGSPEFAPALGLQISVLARDGIEQARLQLNPAEMGPIDVRIALDGSQARIDFQADQAPTRQALQDALPQLAQALQDAGFTLSGGGVSDGSTGRQPQGGAPAGRDGESAQATADSRAGREAAAAVRASAAGKAHSLLDLYA